MISVEVASESGDGSGIVAWTETLEDPREPLAEIGRIMRADIQERWDTETDPWGGAWAPRSITTIEIRQKQGKDPFPARFGASTRTTDGGKGLRVGFNTNFPRFIHEGDPNNRVFGRGRGPRPPRPVLPLRGGSVELPQQLQEEIMAAFRDEIRSEVRRRTGG